MADFNGPLTHGAPSAAPSPADGKSHGTSTVGEPDAQTTPQWCKKCQADVIPRGKGLCPRCGIFLKQNFVARRQARTTKTHSTRHVTVGTTKKSTETSWLT